MVRDADLGDEILIAWMDDGCHVLQAQPGGAAALDLHVCGADLEDVPALDQTVELSAVDPGELALIARMRASWPAELESFAGLSVHDVIEEVTGVVPSDHELRCIARACAASLYAGGGVGPAVPLLADRHDWPAASAARLADLALSGLDFDVAALRPALAAFSSHVRGSAAQSSCRMGLPTSAGLAELEVWAADEGDDAFSAYATYVDPDTGQVPERAFGPDGETTSERDFTFHSSGVSGLTDDLLAACDLAVRGLFVPSADLASAPHRGQGRAWSPTARR